MHQAIVPALIPSDEYSIIKAASDVAFAPEFHLDIVDGDFVSSVSWPYSPEGDPTAVGHALRGFSLEVDLMVCEPVSAATAWQQAGADRLVFHVETLGLADFTAAASESTASVGVSCHGDTPLSVLCEYAAEADFVQLMGIREVGAQGNPFDERVFSYISVVKSELPHLAITVDGSVNEHTITRLAVAGVDRFVVGSAIMKSENPIAAYQHLTELINRLPPVPEH